MKRPDLIMLFLFVLGSALFSCGPGTEQKSMVMRADSLFMNLRCVNSVVKLIHTNYLVPGEKKVRYKLEYIDETWPDTITGQQANKLINLKKLGADYEQLGLLCKKMEQQSAMQLEQLKKLNAEIISGRQNADNLLQYLTFESRSADTLQLMLDSLVKKSIELNCKSYSL